MAVRWVAPARPRGLAPDEPPLGLSVAVAILAEAQVLPPHRMRTAPATAAKMRLAARIQSTGRPLGPCRALSSVSTIRACSRRSRHPLDCWRSAIIRFDVLVGHDLNLSLLAQRSADAGGNSAVGKPFRISQRTSEPRARSCICDPADPLRDAAPFSCRKGR